MTRVGPCRTVRKPRDLITDAPCRTTRPHRPKPAWPSNTKSPSNGDKPLSLPSRPEAPSTDESPPPRSALMPGTKASRPPLIPWFRHLGSASDTRSRAGIRARPCLLPAHAGARGPRAARRLLQLYGPTSTTPTSPNPAASMRCCHRAVGSAVSEEPPPAGLSQFRGNADALAPPPPPRRPPASTWIYPKLIDPDTFCRSPMLPRPGKRPLATTGRIPVPPTTPFGTLWRISSPDPPHPL